MIQTTSQKVLVRRMYQVHCLYLWAEGQVLYCRRVGMCASVYLCTGVAVPMHYDRTGKMPKLQATRQLAHVPHQ
jgi:hypothetical protein